MSRGWEVTTGKLGEDSCAGTTGESTLSKVCSTSKLLLGLGELNSLSAI
jgi:hypothetical protein